MLYSNGFVDDTTIIFAHIRQSDMNIYLYVIE